LLEAHSALRRHRVTCTLCGKRVLRKQWRAHTVNCTEEWIGRFSVSLEQSLLHERSHTTKAPSARPTLVDVDTIDMTTDARRDIYTPVQSGEPPIHQAAAAATADLHASQQRRRTHQKATPGTLLDTGSWKMCQPIAPQNAAARPPRPMEQEDESLRGGRLFSALEDFRRHKAAAVLYQSNS
jgi:hypothetical protein